jgi:hypothetical protein
MGKDPAESRMETDDPSRRRFLRNMAIAAAVAPVVTVLDVAPAAALSPPPSSSSQGSTGGSNGGTTEVAAGTEVKGTEVQGEQLVATQQAAAAQTTKVEGTQLAKTGADIDKMTSVAAAALVAGTGALATGRYLEHRRAAVEGADSSDTPA